MLTKNLNLRAQTMRLSQPIALEWPEVFRWYANTFDKLQYWLIKHYVCIRHQEHKVFSLFMLNRHPPREEMMQSDINGFPIMTSSSVGVAGWVLPHINIIDVLGLNDYVIARMSTFAKSRTLAHERRPPPGYINDYHVNMLLENKKVEIYNRPNPITADYILATEIKWRSKARSYKTPDSNTRSCECKLCKP